MKILSVNLGKPTPVETKSGYTGIYKMSAAGPVIVGEFGLAGDTISDTRNHGGREQAVYLYGQPDYEWWAAELGRRIEPGTFGENLTVGGFESQSILVGDRLTIGEVVLEITSPRTPCVTFATRMGDTGWVKRFQAASRPGAYARVLQPGPVAAGAEVVYERFAGEPVPVTELMEDTRNPAPERMRRLLQAPIHSDMRASFEEKLAGRPE